MKTYNHAYSIGFEVPGSKDYDGEDVTDTQLAIALLRRVANCLENDEVFEAIGAPFDTYEEE